VRLRRSRAVPRSDDDPARRRVGSGGASRRRGRVARASGSGVGRVSRPVRLRASRPAYCTPRRPRPREIANGAPELGPADRRRGRELPLPILSARRLEVTERERPRQAATNAKTPARASAPRNMVPAALQDRFQNVSVSEQVAVNEHRVRDLGRSVSLELSAYESLRLEASAIPRCRDAS